MKAGKETPSASRVGEASTQQEILYIEEFLKHLVLTAEDLTVIINKIGPHSRPEKFELATSTS